MNARHRAVLLLCSCFALAEGCGRSGNDQVITVGSKNFTEQVILGELLAQQIEARTSLKVKRQLNLGGTFICHQALIAGDIDTYVEYTGTALTAILQRPPMQQSEQAHQAEQVFAAVRTAYRERFQVEWLPPLGFSNTFAILIRGDDAARLGIHTLSQLAQEAPRWHAGFGYEFLERADGFPGLARTYGLRFSEPPRVMDLALTYQALADRKVDVIAGDSTNGLISSLNLVVLQDDKHYFPAYEAAPVASLDTLNRFPALRQALSALGGAVTDDDMRQLNYSVDGRRQPVREAVKEFRRVKGL